MSRRVNARSVDRWIWGRPGAATLFGLSDGDLEELLFQARVHFERGEVVHAARIFVLARVVRPDSADAPLGAGARRQLTGHLEGAIDFYDRALILRGDDGHALANRAECLILWGREEGAAASIAAIKPSDPLLQGRIASLRSRSNTSPGE